jgi:glutamate-1-semialdehyde 2,1-aminomutase
MSFDCHQTILRSEDHEFFETELASFVPDRVFDAHAHVWTDKCMAAGRKIPSLPHTAGYPEFSRMLRELHSGRSCAANIFHRICPREHLSEANAWTSEQVRCDSNYRGLFISTPEDDPEWLRQEVRRLGLHGLKCYHLYSDTDPTWEAQIPDYLPELHVQVADQEGWLIMLHLVRSRACADPHNLKWIRHYCETYPNMKMILAHSGRGFQPEHNLEGLPQLKGLVNLHFDTSANCDPMAHQAIIRIIGHEKLMYGTDLPVSHLRGRSVATADSFVWLYEDSPVWVEKHTRIKPVLVGLEHLRSVKWACWSERLSDRQVEDVFWNNAAELFGIR